MSPLLANIYLHKLDRYMESNYLSLTHHTREKRRAQGKGNFLYVRYADDFIVLCNGTKTEAQSIKEELGGFLSTMGLKLSEEKTKITHITEGFTFLGYQVIRSMGRSGKMAPKIFVPESAIKRFQHKVREIFAPRTTKESISAKIQAQNWLTRGWCQYYQITSNTDDPFGKVGAEIFWDMAHWLGRKYKISTPEVMQRYKVGHTFTYKAKKLVMPDEYKAKKFLAKTWKNPYIHKEEIRREKLFSYQQFPLLTW